MSKKHSSEIWRPVRGYEGLYEVSNQGRVRSLQFKVARRIKIMTLTKGDKGYLVVNLYRYQYVCRTHLVHRLVLEAFVGPCPKGMQACHFDGDRANCRLSNLLWDTQKNNEIDKERHGRRQRGSKVGGSKLTEKQVLNLHHWREQGMTYQELAELFGVWPMTFGMPCMESLGSTYLDSPITVAKQ